MEKTYNPLKMWGSYAVAAIFVLLAVYALLNRGDLPSFLAVQNNGSGNMTFLGVIFLVLVFPVAFYGLTLEGAVAPIIYYAAIIITQIVYGFLVGWGIHSIVRRFKG
jgi:hypothetical protein